MSPAATRSGTCAARGSTSVNAPGQKRAARSGRDRRPLRYQRAGGRRVESSSTGKPRAAERPFTLQQPIHRRGIERVRTQAVERVGGIDHQSTPTHDLGRLPQSHRVAGRVEPHRSRLRRATTRRSDPWSDCRLPIALRSILPPSRPVHTQSGVSLDYAGYGCYHPASTGLPRGGGCSAPGKEHAPMPNVSFIGLGKMGPAHVAQYHAGRLPADRPQPQPGQSRGPRCRGRDRSRLVGRGSRHHRHHLPVRTQSRPT